MPTVSFIVPVYNMETYLDNCVQSLVGQTSGDWEAILVDDGSTDNSSAVCDAWASKDSRIRVIHQVNQGVSVARNTGIAAATGQWVVFVDSDDWVNARLLETISPYLAEEIDLIFWGYSEVFGEKHTNRSMGNQEIRLDKSDLEEFQLGVLDRYHQGRFDFTKIHVTGPCSKAYRKSMILDSGCLFPVGITSSEDSIFNFSAFHSARAGVYLPYVLSFFRKHGASETHKYNPGLVENYYSVASILHAMLTQQGKGQTFWDAYNHKVASFFQFITVQYFCHPENTNTYRARRKEFLSARNTSPYKEGFNAANLSTLPLAKKTCIFLLKHRLFFSMDITIRLTHIIG